MAKRLTLRRPIPLDEAVLRFAKPAAREEFARAQSQPWPDFKTEAPMDKAVAFKKLQEILGAVIDHSKIKGEPIWAMQKCLLERLLEGRLEAFGVKTKPEIGHGPQKIPQFIFEKPKVRWAARIIENYGYKFEGVTVRRAAAAATSATLPIRNEQSPTGRPSKANEIEKIIHLLTKRGVDLANMPRKAACDQIRDFAKAELKANITIGYSSPVIQRCLLRTLGKRM